MDINENVNSSVKKISIPLSTFTVVIISLFMIFSIVIIYLIVSYNMTILELRDNMSDSIPQIPQIIENSENPSIDIDSIINNITPENIILKNN